MYTVIIRVVTCQSAAPGHRQRCHPRAARMTLRTNLFILLISYFSFNFIINMVLEITKLRIKISLNNSINYKMSKKSSGDQQN